MAFNSKNLHYEKNEPAFLRRLRNEQGGDRNNVQFTRPKKDRLNTGDDDDGPTIVDDEGADVSKEDYDAMLNGVTEKGATEERLKSEKLEVDKKDEGVNDTEGAEREQQKVAEIGAPGKKRKQAKVIGEDVEDVEVVKNENLKDKKLTGPKKPKKKVKLSFDEPE